MIAAVQWLLSKVLLLLSINSKPQKSDRPARVGRSLCGLLCGLAFHRNTFDKSLQALLEAVSVVSAIVAWQIAKGYGYLPWGKVD